MDFPFSQGHQIHREESRGNAQIKILLPLAMLTEVHWSHNFEAYQTVYSWHAKPESAHFYLRNTSPLYFEGDFFLKKIHSNTLTFKRGNTHIMNEYLWRENKFHTKVHPVSTKYWLNHTSKHWGSVFSYRISFWIISHANIPRVSRWRGLATKILFNMLEWFVSLSHGII